MELDSNSDDISTLKKHIISLEQNKNDIVLLNKLIDEINVILFNRNISFDNDFMIWLHKESDKNSHAQNILGVLYQNGIGVKENLDEGLKLYRLSAEKGNPVAQYNLYCMNENSEESFNWCKRSAEQGFASAELTLGGLYRRGNVISQDNSEAFKWYLSSASHGNADAHSNVGYMFDEGLGVEQNYEKAIEWYRKGTQLGSTTAQNNLAFMYQHGLGVERDINEAIKLYNICHDKGDLCATFNLAKIYEDDPSIENDNEKAFHFYKIVASTTHNGREQINADAQYKVGTMYEYGRGTPANTLEAYKWYKLSATNGNTDAQICLSKLENFITNLNDDNNSNNNNNNNNNDYTITI